MIESHNDPWIERTFRKALKEQRRGGRETRASSLYRGVLRRNADHYGSWINLGVLEFERGQTAEAVRCFTRAQALRPDATEACFNLGKALRTLGDRRSAQKFLEMAYEAAPGDPAVLEELGVLYVETERLAAARALALDGRRRDEAGPAPAVLLARTDLAQGNFEEAEERLEELLVTRPDCHQAFAALAEVRYQSGDADRAVLSMRRALLVNPRSGAYHRQLGVYQGAAGEHESARQSFSRARNLSPGLKIPAVQVEPEVEPDEAWERLRLQASLLERARGYAEKGAWKQGIAEFLALTSKYPYEAVVWQELGWFYEKLREPRRALTLYRKASELDGRNLEVRLRMGRLELELDRPEATRKILESLDESSAGVAEVLELKAEYHRAVGEAREGRRCFEAALARMPNRISALRGVGACLLEEGDPEGAQEAWTRAFRAFPGDAELASDLSDLLQARGRPDDAERVLRAAAERAPAAAGLHTRLARLLLEQRRYGAARKAYRELTLSCQPSRVSEGLDLLEGLIYCRDLRPTRRLMRALARHRTGVDAAGRLALYEAAHAVIQRDGNKFSPAWQRAWQEDPHLDRFGRYLAGVFDPADLEFFQQEVRKLSPLFVGDERILAGLERLAEELRSGRNLRSLPGSG